jgi:AAA+ superfamily predicted ATPase
MSTTTKDLFENIIEFPDPGAKQRYERLVGLDEIRVRLGKEARILLNPALLEAWSSKQHGAQIALVKKFRERSPMFIFHGDVGTGKTELAETFGDRIAREENISVTLYRLSLAARGTGAVGEMTMLISTAFAQVIEAARKIAVKKHKPQGAVILVIDEADSLAQSREFSQMHHEDRAGVNALIRGISGFATANLPAIVVMCTNRLGAIDPAVRRRAGDIFEFTRPNEEQRQAMLSCLLDANVTENEIIELAKATGANGASPYGYTYSDIAQRLLPEILIDSFPDRPVSYERALAIAKRLKPTPPFGEERSS